MPELRDALQGTLGGTYRIERELGGGGMSRVFLAEESALGRRVVLKVLPPEAAAAVSAERFRREVQLAAQLQHPRVVPVHSAGETPDGLLYYTMPYVEGETLRARLAREGALPLADAVRVLREVADALAHAHRRGVVHRDIKPENILLGEGGALVADFGVAKALSAAGAGGGAASATGTGVTVGTPAYMAPEQAAGDPATDHRADLYALGLVAYEMLAGRAPFAGRTPQQLVVAHIAERPEPVLALRPDVPPALADVVMRCLEKQPADRPASAADLVRLLATAVTLPGVDLASHPAAVATRPRKRWRAPVAAVLALGGLCLLGVGYLLLRALGLGPGASFASGGALGQRERILVADFRSPADSALGVTIAEALRTDLSQSPNVMVFDRTVVPAVLRRMRQPAGARLELPLAREVAAREGIRAVVDGEVTLIGGRYLLSARLVSTQTGEPLVPAAQETADEPGEIIPAIGRLSRKLRAKLGESLRDARRTPPLERVTTGSLQALRLYAQGVREEDFAKSAALFEQAIALDTGFAMAYRALAILLANRGGQTARVHTLLQKAVEHGDRLTDVERQLTLGTYYWSGPAPDPARALAAYESAIELDSANAAALNNAAVIYTFQRHFARAEVYGRRAIASSRAAPRAPLFLVLLRAQVGLGKLADAAETVEHFARALPENPDVAIARARLAALRGQYDSAATLLRPLQTEGHSVIAREGAPLELSLLALIRGRVGEARRLAREYRAAQRARGVRSAPLEAALDEARLDIWLGGDSTRALRRVEDALRQLPLDSIDAADRPYERLAEVYSLAGRTDHARTLVAEFDRVRATIKRREDPISRHAMLGHIAVADARYDDAAREFRASYQSGFTVSALPDLARAYDLAGNADSAIAVYARYLDTPFYSRIVADAWHLAPTHKRLGELHDAKGDRANAVAHFARFVELWKDADPALQPAVAAARRRLGGLTDAEKH